MAEYPDDVRYTKSHEWVRARDTFVTLGVTAVAASRLGTASFVELPYPGELFKPGDLLGRLSSATSSKVLRMPFVGHINSVNASLADAPALVTSDPYDAGWLVRIEPGDMAEVDALMDAAQYAEFVEADEA